uniref:J domain-containing protein n=1 Tax=Alexandrium monilatum TaxID=311494 RepID=A0A7S4VET2_9DINO
MRAKTERLPLQGKRAYGLQEDVFKEYIKADFQRRLYELYLAAGDDLLEMATARQKACHDVQFRIIPKYGFEPSRAGAVQCQMAFDYGTGQELHLRGTYLVFLVTQERQEAMVRRFLPQSEFGSAVGSRPHLDLLKRCKPTARSKLLPAEVMFALLSALGETYEREEVQAKLYETFLQAAGKPPEVAAQARQEVCAAIEGPVVAAFGYPGTPDGVFEAWYHCCNTLGGLGNFGSRGEWSYISERSTPCINYVLYLIDVVFHRSEIFVVAADGARTRVVVDLACDVKALKEQVQQETGIPELEQQLTLEGRELCNGAMLSSLVSLGGTVEVALVRRRPEVVSWLGRLREDSKARRPALSLKQAPEELLGDPEFILPAVQEHALALEFAAAALRADREVVRAAVEHSGKALRFAAEELRDDEEVVLWAVGQRGLALDYASDRLQGARAVVLAAVRQDGSALECAAVELRADREVVLEAVRGDGFAILMASEELQADVELATAAVRQDWKVLGYLSEELRASRQVAAAAVGESGAALKFVAPALRASRELVKTAIETCPEALHYAAQALRSDRELAMAAVQKDGTALRCVPPEAQDLEMALAAVRQTKLAVQFVAEPLQAAVAEARGWQQVPETSHVIDIGEARQKLKRHFQTLGLSEKAPEEEVKRRYRQLALRHHPDKHPDDPEGAKRRFQQIGGAYQAIKEVLGL